MPESSVHNYNTRYPPVDIHSQANIRLVHLLAGSFNDRISCNLTAETLPDNDTSDDGSAMSYEALSYTWGEWRDVKSIWVNDTEMLVSKNLWLALRRLRRETGPPRIFWIDQICINQLDFQESSRQVRLMGSIFRLAAKVIVWLGDRENTVARGQRSIGHGDSDADFAEIRMQYLAVTLDIKPFWPTRAWILQEFALARHEPLVCFGNITIPWPSLDACLVRLRNDEKRWLDDRGRFTLLENQGQSNERRYLPGYWARMAPVRQPWTQDLDLFRQQQYPQRLLSLVLRTIPVTSSDPRDRLYSLIDLVEEGSSIPVDYNARVSQIFAQGTHAAIALGRTLEILCVARGPEGINVRKLPSWSVGFERSSHCKRDRSRASFENLFMGLSNTKVPSLAGIITCPTFDTERLTLRLKGIVLAHVSMVLSFNGSKDKYVTKAEAKEKNWNLEGYDWFRRLLNHVKCTLAAKKDIAVGSAHYESHKNVTASIHGDASCTTFLTRSNLPRPSFGNSPVSPDYFEAQTDDDNMQSFFKGWVHTLEEGQERTHDITSWYGQNDSSRRRRSEYGSCSRDWQTYCRGPVVGQSHAFFMTHGGYVGCAPSTISAGDLVILPQWYRFPIVLRPVKGGHSYQFVSFAHVTGFMLPPKSGAPCHVTTKQASWRSA